MQWKYPPFCRDGSIGNNSTGKRQSRQRVGGPMANPFKIEVPSCLCGILPKAAHAFVRVDFFPVNRVTDRPRYDFFHTQLDHFRNQNKSKLPSGPPTSHTSSWHTKITKPLLRQDIADTPSRHYRCQSFIKTLPVLSGAFNVADRLSHRLPREERHCPTGRQQCLVRPTLTVIITAATVLRLPQRRPKSNRIESNN